jgi:hypothetical protein
MMLGFTRLAASCIEWMRPTVIEDIRSSEQIELVRGW